MTKINQKEYETLKKMQKKGHKFIARTKEGHVIVFTAYHGKSDSRWLVTTNRDDYKYESLYNSDEIFLFIGWEDEKPYSIAELIKEYEFGKILLAMAEEETVLELEYESEETEVKNIEWAKEELFEKAWEENKAEYLIHLESVYKVIDQLDTREVLSNEWIENHTACAYNITHYSEEPVAVILVDDLKGLLLDPNLSNSMGLELPVIPKFVAEFLIGKEDYMLYELFEDEWLYKEHNRVAKWLYDNDELTNKQREIDLVMARDRGYLVEEEQKYQVIIRDGEYIWLYLCKNHDIVTFGTNVSYLEKRPEVTYLTEQEIKDYDERFWPFAEVVTE